MSMLEMEEASEDLIKEESQGSRKLNDRMRLRIQEAITVADNYKKLSDDYCKKTQEATSFLVTEIRRNRILDYQAKLLDIFEIEN
jgi:hypothetical protein